MNSFAADNSQPMDKKEADLELQGLDLAKLDIQQLANSAGLPFLSINSFSIRFRNECI